MPTRPRSAGRDTRAARRRLGRILFLLLLVGPPTASFWAWTGYTGSLAEASREGGILLPDLVDKRHSGAVRSKFFLRGEAFDYFLEPLPSSFTVKVTSEVEIGHYLR